ncbi:unnamed protein product [Closterium sp. NIES-64]|nr:unnamed protein product [Closterium sp. NIES-64]
MRKRYKAKAAPAALRREATSDAIASVTSSGKRSRITDYLETDAAAGKRKAHEALALMFAGCRIRERVADHPLYINAVCAIGDAGTGYVPPKKGFIGGVGLGLCCDILKRGLSGVKASWKRTGVTISSDMMTDKNGRPQANLFLVNESGAVFKDCVDCRMESKTGGYVANILKLVVEEVGLENVVAFCMDGGSNYAVACNQLIAEWPHIQHVPCGTHVLDLFMEDIGKMPWAKKVVEPAAGGSIGRGAGRAQGNAPGSPPRPMQGRVGDGPGGAGVIFVGGLRTVPAPTSRRSFRYDGPRPPPSGQTPTQPESGSEEEDEEEDGEGEKEEDTEGSGDDNEAAWDPETHGGGEGGDDDDEDHEMDGLEPEGREEEVGEGGGRAATKAGSQHVREGGGSVGVKVGGRKAVTIREPRQRKKTKKLRERAYPCTFTGEPLGEGVIAPEFLDEDGGPESSKGTGKGETFPRGGYKGVADGYVYQWPHAKTWLQLDKGKGMATGGGDGSGGMERWMTTKLTSVQLRQVITKLVVTCDLPFRIVEAEAFRELLILLNRNCAQNFIPSRWTVSRDTVVYAAAALQAWLVVTGHWINENYQLRTMVFEFREIHGRHTGKQMARVVEETVVQWGLETRCLGFTSDNASSNTPAFRWMSEEGGGQCFFNSRMHFQYKRECAWDGVSKADKAKMDTLRLTDADWETLHFVKTFLSPFAKVSKAAEGAAYPTVSMVLPYYNGLIDAMESRLAKGPSATLKPIIEAALGLLKKYELMSSNELWIATFLDPSMKAAWFDDAHWETLHPYTERRARPRPSSGEVIQLVRERVAEYQAWAAAIAPRPTPLAPVTEEDEGDAADDDEDAEFLPSRRRLAARLSASQEAGRGGMVQDDEVGRYLSERVQGDVSALEYWRSATNMQTLRRMARDYLAIRATSASSERVFSLGRNLISWKRHRLVSQRTRASMILRSWYTSHPGQRIGEGRRAKGEAPPEFAIEGEGEEEDDEWEEEEGEEEQVGVGVGDTSDAEHAVVGSSSGVHP